MKSLKESIFDDVEDIVSNDSVLIEQFLKDNYDIVGTYTINKDGSVDVKGTVEVKNVKIVGFDNLDAIEKYKINIDSVGYSIPEIARLAVDIIVGKKNSGVIVNHRIVEHAGI